MDQITNLDVLALDDQHQANHILQIADLLTSRKCALRIDKQDTQLPLGQLLDKYLKHFRSEYLLVEHRITATSAETLSAFQELVYLSSDSGMLGDVFAGMEFHQGNRRMLIDAIPATTVTRLHDTPISLLDISIDRTNLHYDRNWAGFSRRRWDKHHQAYCEFVESVLVAEYGSKEASNVLQLSTEEHWLKFILALAKTIWASDFESYSRFIGARLAHKTGDETLLNIMSGRGGICAEKVTALKFIMDHYGLSSEYVIAGPDVYQPVPEEKLRELLDSFDFQFSKRYMRYWQHMALRFDIEGTELLVDATNGNIPLLFLKGDAAERVLDYRNKQPISIKMVVEDQDFYYHRVSPDIPQNLLFAMETWMEYVDLMQVFENELGLFLSEDFYVAPIVFKDENSFRQLKEEYVQACVGAGVGYDIRPEWTLESDLGAEFMSRSPRAARDILEGKDYLVSRYDEWEEPGHDAGLIIMKLSKRDNTNR